MTKDGKNDALHIDAVQDAAQDAAQGDAKTAAKYVVVVEAVNGDISDVRKAQLIKALELSEAKAQQLLTRIPGVVTKAVDKSEAELIAERFRWAGFEATTRLASQLSVEPKPLQPSENLSEAEAADPEASAAKAPIVEAPTPSESVLNESTSNLASPSFQATPAENAVSATEAAQPRAGQTEAVPELPLSGVAPKEARAQLESDELSETVAVDDPVSKPASPEPISQADAAPDSFSAELAMSKDVKPTPAELNSVRDFVETFAAEPSEVTGFERLAVPASDKPAEPQPTEPPQASEPRASEPQASEPQATPQSLETQPSEPQLSEPQPGEPQPTAPAPSLLKQAAPDLFESEPETSRVTARATVVAEDYGLLPRANSLWLRRLVLALPAFLSVLVVVVYMRGGLASSINEALRWAPVAVTDVLAESLTAQDPATLGSRLERLQPTLSARGVEMVLLTDTSGRFVAGWLGDTALTRTPRVLIGSLPQLINAAQNTEPQGLSLGAGELGGVEVPLILDARLLESGGTQLVLSVGTPDSAAAFMRQLTRSSLLAGLIPVLLTIIAALVFIRKPQA